MKILNTIALNDSDNHWERSVVMTSLLLLFLLFFVILFRCVQSRASQHGDHLLWLELSNEDVPCSMTGGLRTYIHMSVSVYSVVAMMLVEPCFVALLILYIYIYVCMCIHIYNIYIYTYIYNIYIYIHI